jgi:hypothetical protein
MTLRDKFLNSPCEKGYINMNIYRAENNVKIAEQFAINFANWYHFMIEQVDNLNSKFTPKELIERFKKEKGL